MEQFSFSTEPSPDNLYRDYNSISEDSIIITPNPGLVEIKNSELLVDEPLEIGNNGLEIKSNESVGLGVEEERPLQPIQAKPGLSIAEKMKLYWSSIPESSKPKTTAVVPKQTSDVEFSDSSSDESEVEVPSLNPKLKFSLFDDEDVDESLLPPKTKNEVSSFHDSNSDLINFTCPDSKDTVAFGVVSSILPNSFVISSLTSNEPEKHSNATGKSQSAILNIGCVIIDADMNPIGKVDDVFGPIVSPFYTVQLLTSTVAMTFESSLESIKENTNLNLGFANDYSKAFPEATKIDDSQTLTEFDDLISVEEGEMVQEDGELQEDSRDVEIIAVFVPKRMPKLGDICFYIHADSNTETLSVLPNAITKIIEVAEIQEMKTIKGSDASNLYDEECYGADVDYSDDEHEMQQKSEKNRKKHKQSDQLHSVSTKISKSDRNSTIYDIPMRVPVGNANPLNNAKTLNSRSLETVHDRGNNSIRRLNNQQEFAPISNQPTESDHQMLERLKKMGYIVTPPSLSPMPQGYSNMNQYRPGSMGYQPHPFQPNFVPHNNFSPHQNIHQEFPIQQQYFQNQYQFSQMNYMNEPIQHQNQNWHHQNNMAGVINPYLQFTPNVPSTQIENAKFNSNEGLE